MSTIISLTFDLFLKGAAFEGCAVDNAEMAMHDVLDTHRMATATDRHSADDLQEAYDVH